MTYGGRWYRVPVFDGIWYKAELVGVTVGRYLSEWLIMHIFCLSCRCNKQIRWYSGFVVDALEVAFKSN